MARLLAPCMTVSPNRRLVVWPLISLGTALSLRRARMWSASRWATGTTPPSARTASYMCGGAATAGELRLPCPDMPATVPTMPCKLGRGASPCPTLPRHFLLRPLCVSCRLSRLRTRPLQAAGPGRRQEPLGAQAAQGLHHHPPGPHVAPQPQADAESRAAQSAG